MVWLIEWRWNKAKNRAWDKKRAITTTASSYAILIKRNTMLWWRLWWCRWFLSSFMAFIFIMGRKECDLWYCDWWSARMYKKQTNKYIQYKLYHQLYHMYLMLWDLICHAILLPVVLVNGINLEDNFIINRVYRFLSYIFSLSLPLSISYVTNYSKCVYFFVCLLYFDFRLFGLRRPCNLIRQNGISWAKKGHATHLWFVKFIHKILAIIR